jgi:hypothetical protein
MSARVCLLCGKSLSRIWSGSGEDFCSREHRNQYRLRRGMDRLHEANQVANVMRRRENPRPIHPSRLIREGSKAPRDFPELKPFQVPAAADSAVVPSLALGSAVRLPASGPLNPAPAATTLRPQSYQTCPFPLRAHTDLSAIPFSSLAGTTMPEAAPPLACDVAIAIAPKPLANGFEIRCTRAHPIIAPTLGTAAGLALAAALSHSRPARPLSRAHEGRELRVSMAAAFRVPGSPSPSISSAGPDPAGATWLPALAYSVLRVASYARPRLGTTTVRIEAVNLNEPAMRVLPVPPPSHVGAFRWPGVMKIRTVFLNPSVRHRTLAVPFGDEDPGKERFDEYRN